MQYSENKHLIWHDAVWQRLWRSDASIPHALLLAGPAGIGKHAFAQAAAARMLCESPTSGVACGACPSCHWLAGSNHPDFRYLRPESEVETDGDAPMGEKKKASQHIRIEQIRELEDFVFVGSHRGGARLVVIEPAEAMNVAAQNALLKILEEPSVAVYFIVVTSRLYSLLPTILSRCRVMKLPKPSLAEASAWLTGMGEKEALELLPWVGGAPLRALAESQSGRTAAFNAVVASLAEPGSDPLSLAARWELQLQLKDEAALSMESLIGVVHKWVLELVERKLASRGRYFTDRSRAIDKLAGQATVGGLIRCYNDLVKMRGLASHPLNPRLYLEELAERYLRAISGGREARG